MSNANISSRWVNGKLVFVKKPENTSLLELDPSTNTIRIPEGVTFDYDGGEGVSISWGDVTGKPESFPPATHAHVINDVTGLQVALDSKATTAAIPVASTTSPAALGASAAVGVSGTFARADHVHARQTAAQTSIAAISGVTGTSAQAALEDLAGRIAILEAGAGG